MRAPASVIDLRSDTVTRPTAGMRRAMAEAEVGDDVLDGDPTVRRLEAQVAALLGKERGLFFPSGTMANQTAIWIQTTPGKGWFAILRLYSPLEPFFTKEWRLSEIEPVK